MLVHTGRRYGSATNTVPDNDDPALYHGPGVPWYVMLSKGKYKYIRNLVKGETEELYQMQQDPEELTNLASSPDHRELLLEFRQSMIKELKRTDAGLVDNLPSASTD